MNKYLACLLVAGVFAAGCDMQQSQEETSQQTPQQEDGKKELSLDTQAQKRSYALGMDIGNSIKDLPVELQVKYLAAGITDTVQGKAQLSDEEFQQLMQAFVGEMESAQQEQQSAAAQENLEAGEAFLAKNKEKEGVQVTDSGLQYKVLKKGEGKQPQADDTVRVHYEGRLIDGTVFDSSHERGEPVTFPVKAVIPGWTEALQLMREGAEYRLFIPSDLAYGERGAGGDIGPNETLIFDVELLKVNPEENQTGNG